MPEAVVIVGAGQAGGEVAMQLRQKGFPGSITMIGEEPQSPYLRPPLSKAFLAGEINEEALLIRSAATYQKAKVDIRTGIRVTAIDRHNRYITLEDKTRLGYDALVLATGGRPRKLRIPGSDLRNIFYIRTIADVQALQPEFISGRRLTIVGGGYVGLEVTAVAIKSGMAVTVLEGASRVLARVTAPEMSSFYEAAHRAQGVEIRTSVAVSSFIASQDGLRVAGVECGQNITIDTDLVVVGIGLVPNTELAEAAGLIIDSGILIDDSGRTADTCIYAIGDCATHAHHGFLGYKVRLESVPNAIEQARIAACAISNLPIPIMTAPWFWSEQYDLKLQMVGLSEGHDTVVLRGRAETSSFMAFYFRNGIVIAADSVNRLQDFMTAKQIVAQRLAIPVDLLADDSGPLKAMLKSFSASLSV